MKPQIFIEKLSFNDGTELQIGHSDIVIFTGVYVVTEKCTRFSLKSVPLERRIKGNKSLLFLS